MTLGYMARWTLYLRQKQRDELRLLRLSGLHFAKFLAVVVRVGKRHLQMVKCTLLCSNCFRKALHSRSALREHRRQSLPSEHVHGTQKFLGENQIEK